MAGRSGSFPTAAGGGIGTRPDEDRRETGERRRSARGLFEVRARRDGVAGDRRQAPDQVPPTWRRLLRRLKP